MEPQDTDTPLQPENQPDSQAGESIPVNFQSSPTVVQPETEPEAQTPEPVVMPISEPVEPQTPSVPPEEPAVVQPVEPVQPTVITPGVHEPSMPQSMAAEPVMQPLAPSEPPATSVESMVQAVESELPQPVAQPTAVMSPDVTNQPTPPAKKSKKLLLIIITAIVVLLLAGGAYVFLMQTPKVDAATFEKNFTSCKRSMNISKNDSVYGGDATTKINGKKGSGCSVTIDFGTLKGDAAPLSHKVMTCELDNSKDLSAAFLAAVEDPSASHCSGSLVDYIKSTENKAK